jgi:hypothetical protein
MITDAALAGLCCCLTFNSSSEFYNSFLCLLYSKKAFLARWQVSKKGTSFIFLLFHQFSSRSVAGLLRGRVC